MQLPDTDRFVYLPIRKPRIMDESFKRDVAPEKAKKPELVSKAATKIETIPQKRPAPDSNIAQEKPKQPKIEPLIKGSPDASKTAKQEGSNKKEQLPDTKKPKIRVAIESCTVVEENSKDYEIQDPESISLVYPNGNEKYLLAQPKSDDYDPIDDIYTTVQLIASDCVSDDKKHLFGDKKAGIVRNIVRACHKKNFVDLKKHMLEFNSVMQSLKDQHLFDSQGVKPASPDLILHAFNQAYARSIAPHANQLNKYQGFSSNVYGEINYSFVREIIKNAEIKKEHVFLDLGSGIGNVVLQVAAECLCECYGIEIMENPAQLAKKQRNEFLARMQYYQKPCGRIFLKQGDFLKETSIIKLIAKADVIFVNNYVFDPELNQGILAMFLDLKENAKVVSLRSFVPRTSSSRRINAIESIFTVKDYQYPRGSVSWMMDGGNYYIHTVDRSLLSSMSRE